MLECCWKLPIGYKIEWDSPEIIVICIFVDIREILKLLKLFFYKYSNNSDSHNALQWPHLNSSNLLADSWKFGPKLWSPPCSLSIASFWQQKCQLWYIEISCRSGRFRRIKNKRRSCTRWKAMDHGYLLTLTNRAVRFLVTPPDRLLNLLLLKLWILPLHSTIQANHVTEICVQLENE